MRVLIVHNQYGSGMPSGENDVVAEDIRRLRDAGVDVSTYLRSSDEIKTFNWWHRATLAIRPVYSFEDAAAIRNLLRAHRPDVVHLHNPFPLISPAVVRVAKADGIPVVQTVHNYRHSCPAGQAFRDGRPCQDCSGRAVGWPAVMHACYRDSRAESAVMVAADRAHRGTWQMVDRFLPVSDFVAERLLTTGIPPERITVRPNSTEPRGPARPLGSGFLFAGRLTHEKGVSLLLAAWNQSSAWKTQRLVVAGDGPEKSLVTNARGRNVHYAGVVGADQMAALLDESAALVLPSVWWEGFPRVVVEAFERGRPVAATSIGSLRDLITDDVGWTAPPDPRAFADMLGFAASDPRAASKGACARATFESAYIPAATTQLLLDVYAQVVEDAQTAAVEPHA